MNLSAKSLGKQLRRAASPAKAKVLQHFFKTGPGEYGEGDVFLGVKVPDTRRVARAHRDLSWRDLAGLLHSPFHEERLAALLILVDRYDRGDEAERRRVYGFYVRHLDRVNNWDLVDVSADKIAGRHHFGRGTVQFDRWARSPNLWFRRVAILSTFWFIRQDRFGETLRIVKRLLKDPEDLLHKACGWMLREVGKRDVRALEKFLRADAPRMPRTMLRYAIERFPEAKRRRYLAAGR